jgi:hypothetical protein
MTPIEDITPTTQIRDGKGLDWTWAYVVFRPIAGFPDYLIGSNGTVWGRQASGTGSRKLKYWRRLATGKNRDYRWVILCKGKTRRQEYVHTLVLEAFIGPRPEGMEACHFPIRDAFNNDLRNLRWDTALANMQDMKAHGTGRRGEGHYRTRLTKEAVREIRDLAAGGVGYPRLAERFQVGVTTIYKIVHRKNWKHV